MSELKIEGLCRSFGAVDAVKDINLSVDKGEFVTLLGPSGCGKSTTLFMIAGLDRPSSGRITVADRVFFDSAARINVAPERRNCGLVFQSYALWPHMTVAQNVAFPLRLRRIPRRQRGTIVTEALELVEMGAFSGRYPHELSGGQQQRAALARTLAFKPSVLLLDEPLSNLDAKLRAKARLWLKALQRQVGLTTIYVTHDQIEALSLSDRIAVMNRGQIVQLDKPEQIYRRPVTSFVAEFVGSSNFIRGELVRETDDHGAVIRLPDGSEIAAAWMPDHGSREDVSLSVRAERVSLSGQPPADRAINALKGRVIERSYQGGTILYTVQLASGVIQAESPVCIDLSDVWACFSPQDAVALPGVPALVTDT
jgi:iron(III) transport system ATP-binding protein